MMVFTNTKGVQLKFQKMEDSNEKKPWNKKFSSVPSQFSKGKNSIYYNGKWFFSLEGQKNDDIKNKISNKRKCRSINGYK